jgi:hypothetical protein
LSNHAVSDAAFEAWLAAAEKRYLADLTRAELGRALRALSSCYVERRQRISEGRALEGLGKRGAFALYYAPLHFLTVRSIASEICAPTGSGARPILDLGCGTGAAGAAWALVSGAGVSGTDVSQWAVQEAAWTYGTLGVRGEARRGGIGTFRLPTRPSLLLAAFVINELTPADRTVARNRLLSAAGAGHQVVVIEPIARTVTPWWGEWEQAFGSCRPRSAEWRFRVDLPPLLRDLDRSSGLNHRELTARTLTANV